MVESGRESATQSRDEKFLNSLHEAVLNNLSDEHFGVSELSHEVAISRFQLHRKLKVLKGVSISQYLRETRLEEAMRLLKADVATVSEVAFRVGFSSPSYFNSCFQKYYGFPPGEVKKMKGDGMLKGRANKSSSAETAQPTSTHSPFHNINLRHILAAVGALIVLAAVFYLVSGRRDAAIKPRDLSIAVLPLSNLSTDPNNQFFADGLVEDLLNRLSMIEGFKVISRTSSEMYREKGTKSVPQIARELGVSYIIEGSVQRDASTARIAIQLIDGNSDSHIWSKLFDADINDIFQAQSEIALRVASEMNALLTSEQITGIQTNRTGSVKAFELYQMGRFHWNKRTGEGYETSIRYFEQAIAEDPDYGLAYAGLADTYNLMALQGWIDTKTGRDSAEVLAFKALELDPSLAEAHNVLASIYTYVDMNWDEAEKEYLRAIKLNPNYATAHHYYSEHLSIIGKHEEARNQINLARQLDPLSYIIHFVSAKLFFGRGDLDRALTDIAKCHELFDNHPGATAMEFQLNYLLGNEAKMLESFKRYSLATGRHEPVLIDRTYRTSGSKGLLELSLTTTDWTYGKAYYHGLMGNDARAMDLLEASFTENDFNPEFTFQYAFRNLRSHPRFRALVRKMGIPGT